jgi:hypothetical protein
LHRSDDARARPPFRDFPEDIGPEMPSGNSSCCSWTLATKSVGRNSRENLRELRAQIHERRLLPSLSKPHLRSNILPIVKSVTSFPAWSHRSDYKEVFRPARANNRQPERIQLSYAADGWKRRRVIKSDLAVCHLRIAHRFECEPRCGGRGNLIETSSEFWRKKDFL